MSDKFKGKYRIESARLKNWDYGSNASYFVTICTQNRECFFGDVLNGEMILNGVGFVAHNFWMVIPEHFPFVKLGEHVVMPNHVHGIVVIDKPVETPKLGVSTTTPTTTPTPTPTNRTAAASEKWNPGTLGVIMNQYKRAVTIGARKINPHFDWQSSFHDHVIRNEDSFQRISEYIKHNPANWKDDKFYK